MKDRNLYAPHGPVLRGLIDAVGVPPLLALARRPGVRELFRVAVHHHDGRVRDSVATLIDNHLDGVRLENVYRVTFHEKALVYRIPSDRYTRFLDAVRGVNFDQLHDQPDLPPYGADLWLVERAAGTYVHDVIVAPALADGPHWTLVSAIRMYVPEALREVA